MDKSHLVDVYLGRQPIFNTRQETVAYELLYRSGDKTNAFPKIDGSEATSRLLYNIYCSMGISEVVGAKKAFINFTRELLLAELPSFFRPEHVVVEILESVVIDKAVIEACKRIAANGFELAMDDFVLKKGIEPLLSLASIIKIDWLATDQEEIKNIYNSLQGYKLDFLAEKIETQEDLDSALALDFTYLQGYFFARPVILSCKDIPLVHHTWLRILWAIVKPMINLNEITDIISHDPSLSYKLLKIINSAAYAFRENISSIRQAIVLLGDNEIRKWLSLLVMTKFISNKPKEIMITACVRGRFGELAAEHLENSDTASKVFFLGILSFLDTITGISLEDLLAKTPVDTGIPQALLGHKGPLSPYLDLMLAYERADEEAIVRSTDVLGLDHETAAEFYLDAIRWTESHDVF